MHSVWVFQPVKVKKIMKSGYWLISTEHLQEGLWFREEADFKVGMNFVAIQAHLGRVRVLAFILMSNHVHFVLGGSRDEAVEFVNEFRRRYSIYYSRKYGSKEFLRRNDVDYKLLEREDEALEKAVAYVQMNCVAANICLYPYQYLWGTGKAFFNLDKTEGQPVSSFSRRALRGLLHSECSTLPGEWLVCNEGYILPQSYVDVEEVESCFKTAKRMYYFLNTSSKAKKRLDSSAGTMPAFRDQIIVAAIPDLCQSLFGKRSFDMLTPEEETEVMRQIAFRFSATVKQIARVCGLSYEAVTKMMDTV